MNTLALMITTYLIDHGAYVLFWLKTVFDASCYRVSSRNSMVNYCCC